MAKKQKDTKPIFPLKHEFYDSLDRFIHEATMLADAVRFLIDHGDLKPSIKETLQARLTAFNAARHSDED